MSYTPQYGPPGPSTGWQNGPSGGTEIDKAALDHMEQGIIDSADAADEIAPGAPGSRMVSAAKIPSGAGGFVLDSDARLSGTDPLLVYAPLIIYETTPGVYTRPATTRRIIFLGTVAALPGGTTAGGTGTNVAVSGKDVALKAMP